MGLFYVRILICEIAKNYIICWKPNILYIENYNLLRSLTANTTIYYVA